MRAIGAIAGLWFLAGCGGAQLRNPHVRVKGNELFLKGDFVQAAGHYEAYLADNPGDPDRGRILLLAGKCHLGAGHSGKAIALFDTAKEGNPDAALRCELAFRRGVANRMRGRAAEAVIDLRRSASEAADVRARVVPADEFYYEYALALFHNGEWTKGREQMERVGADGPFGAQARSRRGLHGFTVQLGAFSNEDRARRAASRLRAEVRSVRGDGPLFLVSAGPYARIEDAREQARHYRSNGCPDAFVLP